MTDCGDGGAATNAEFFYNYGVSVVSSAGGMAPVGSVIISDTYNDAVRYVAPSGTIELLAGTYTNGNRGNGAAATSARVNRPQGTCVDAAGQVYIADTGNNAVRVVDTNGNINLFAGLAAGTAGYSGDGGQATSATLTTPMGCAVTPSGSAVLIADYTNNAVRSVDIATGVITTVAGDGTGT